MDRGSQAPCPTSCRCQGREGTGPPTAAISRPPGPRCDPRRTSTPASSASAVRSAVRCPREFDALMCDAGGQRETGSRRWLCDE
jgi:hypothetical protein